VADIEEAVAEIYSKPHAGFIAARDATARRLRNEGKDEEAKVVGKLRKPRLPAWALTRLAATDSSAFDPLDEADERVREAMGVSKAADKVRKATENRHKVISDIVDAAADLLEADGHAATTTLREKIAQTVYALASEVDSRDKLLRGEVTRELQPSGLGFGSLPDNAFDEEEAPAPSAAVQKRAARLAEAAEAAEKRAADLARQLEEAEAELRALQKEVEELRKHAARAASDADEKRRALEPTREVRE
jgi:hypothetical protein